MSDEYDFLSLLLKSNFKLVVGASVVIKGDRGYKESDVYVYEDKLFFKDGTYYVSLLSNNLTGGKSNFQWVKITGVEYEIRNGWLYKK